MKILETIAVAFSMYSKIPMPHFEWTKENMRYAMCAFPLVGAVIGLVFYLAYRICVLLGLSVLFRASLLVLVPVIISGGIHLDGFIDTSDALSSWQTKERRLEILKDPHVGAFAVICCCAYFAAMFGAMSEMDLKGALVLAAGFILSRTLSAYGVCTFKKARPDGTAAAFANAAQEAGSRSAKRISQKILILEAAAGVLIMVIADPLCGAFAAVSALICCAACHRMALKQFGGITGDIQGFFLQVCELVMAYAVIAADCVSSLI